MKKILAIFTALLLGIVGLTVNAIPAEAHNNSVSATCEKLSVSLTSYADDNNPNHKNTVKVVINGDVKVDNADFGSSFSGSWNFPQTQINSWSVKVTAWDSSQYNLNKSGTQKPCNKPDKPDGSVVQNDQGTCDTTYSSRTRKGVQAYKFDESSWSWVKDGDVKWDKWVETAWTDDAWFKSCAPDKPKDIVVPFSDKKQDCTGVYETSWDMVTGHVWNPSTRKWDETTPTKENFVDWHRTGDASNEYYDANCKPDQPAPEPRVKSEENCTLNDVGGINNYTGTEAYVWNSDTRKWELSGVIVWNDPVFAAYTDTEWWDKGCGPKQPKPEVVTKYVESCDLHGVGGRDDYTGTQAYVKSGREWVLVPDSEIVWNDPIFTPMSDEAWWNSTCAKDQPEPKQVTKSEESCELGGVNNYTGTQAYVKSGREWILGEIVWNDPVFTPYTDEEYLAKGCTEYPGDKVVPKSSHKENCDGLWDRNWDVVTTYTLKDHEWVANDSKIQNDTGWILDRKLTKAEKADKGCVIPDEVLAYTGVSDEGIMVYGAAGLGAILIGLMTVGFLRRRRA